MTSLSSPTRSSKQYLERVASTNAQLKKFLKAKGCTTTRKRRQAIERAAVKEQ